MLYQSLKTEEVIGMDRESYLYDKIDTELYKTDGYGGSDADVDDTERFTRNIDLTVKLNANIDFIFTGSGRIDDLVLSLYKRRDANWAGNEMAIWNTKVNNNGLESSYNYTLNGTYGAGHYKFGISSSGSKNTFEMDVEMRQWRKTTSIA